MPETRRSASAPARWLAKFRRNPGPSAALVFLAVVVALAALAPWLPITDPTDADPMKRVAAVGSHGYWLGGDNQGRDILARLIWGARISLTVAVAPTLIATLLSLVLGIAAGYHGRWLDQIIMRTLDVFFAFPLVLLAIAIAGVLQPGVLTEIIAIIVVLTPYVSRVARTSAGQVASQTYVEAARASGASSGALLLRYVAPNAAPPVLVYATNLCGLMIVVGSGLSFLGLGVQPPAADWGAMVADGGVVLRKAAHVTVLPGLAIVLAALSFSTLGEALRAALDPRSRKAISP
jgi:peptide/nickel transport system permease protein